MGKPALGKGMRDLIAKNFGAETKEEVTPDRQKALEELETILSRYQAQGYDVSYLESLRDSETPSIANGIDAYRVAIKVLAGAQTQLRTLEGYGYTKEIEAITSDIRDPLKAEDVLRRVEELKERALSEHNLKPEKKDASKVKIPESLKLASKKLRADDACSPTGSEEVVIDPACLDALLDNLDTLSVALAGHEENDPHLLMIADWESKGYFVDRLKTAYSEGREVAEMEIARFEEDLRELEKLKVRYRSMDLSGFEKERKDLELRFQYPHLWFEIKQELDRLAEITGGKEHTKIPEVPKEAPIAKPIERPSEATVRPPMVKEEVKVAPPKAPPLAPAPVPKPPEAGERTIEATLPQPPKDEAAAPAVDSSLSASELLERARDACSQERFTEAIALFKEVLVKDPDNSKAKFMIKRLSSKVQ